MLTNVYRGINKISSMVASDSSQPSDSSEPLVSIQHSIYSTGGTAFVMTLYMCVCVCVCACTQVCIGVPIHVQSHLCGGEVHAQLYTMSQQVNTFMQE